MSASVVRVTPDWLDLREPADAAARSTELVERLRPRLPAAAAAARPLVIHDLGGGSGAMSRWLAPLLSGAQHWVVHDRDPRLLGLAAAESPRHAADGATVTVEPRESDVTALTPDDLEGAHLIVASALLDMLTAGELAAMLARCTEIGCPILLALTVVGCVEITPADPLDARMAAAFNAHQRRTTAAGRLLGPDAAPAAAETLRATGREVVVRASPWRLNGADAALTTEWLDGWIAAACEQEPALAETAAACKQEPALAETAAACKQEPALAETAAACKQEPALAEAAGAYRDRRLAQAAAGALAVTVDHVDLLALP